MPSAVGGAARVQAIEGGENPRPLVSWRRLQHEARCAGVDDDGHAVVCGQLAGQQTEGVFEQRQLVLAVHGPGHVQQEHQIRRWTSFRVRLVAADTDGQQQGLVVPRRRRDLGADRERRVAILWQRIVIRKVVDQFLDAHRVRRRQPSVVQKAPHVGIGAGVHVDAECRHGVFANEPDGVVVQRRVVFPIRRLDRPDDIGVEWLRRRSGRILGEQLARSLHGQVSSDLLRRLPQGLPRRLAALRPGILWRVGGRGGLVVLYRLRWRLRGRVGRYRRLLRRGVGLWCTARHGDHGGGK